MTVHYLLAQVISPNIPSEIALKSELGVTRPSARPGSCRFPMVSNSKQSTGEDQHRTLGTKSGLISNSTMMQLCATTQSEVAFAAFHGQVLRIQHIALTEIQD
jgi:hypothetical protein